MGSKYALIIGNSEYNDSGLSQLTAPDADVAHISRVLTDPNMGGFPPESVKGLLNPSRAEAERAITVFFSNRQKDDLLVLYFAGHGILDARGRLYLAVKDTERALLAATGIRAAFITEQMDDCRSRRQVLFLDCCHGGAFERGTRDVDIGRPVDTEHIFEGNGYGRIIITASDATQVAWEGEHIIGSAENSLFAHFLLRGIETGQADDNGDGEITVDELFKFVYERVIQHVPQQVPGMWTRNLQGDLVIARNPNRDAVRIKNEEVASVTALLTQQYKEFKRHGLLLDEKQIQAIRDQIGRLHLDLDAEHYQLLLASAMEHHVDVATLLEDIGPRALSWLREILVDATYPDRARLQAASALGKLEDEATYEALQSQALSGKRDAFSLRSLAYFIFGSSQARKLPVTLWLPVEWYLINLYRRQGSAKTRSMLRAAALSGGSGAAIYAFVTAGGLASIGINPSVALISLDVWLIMALVGVILIVVWSFLLMSLCFSLASRLRLTQIVLCGIAGGLLGQLAFVFITFNAFGYVLGFVVGLVIGSVVPASRWRSRLARWLIPAVATGFMALLYTVIMVIETVGRTGEPLSTGDKAGLLAACLVCFLYLWQLIVLLSEPPAVLRGK